MRQMDGRRVVVTGAAGFIGRAVVARIDGGVLGPVGELVLNDVQAVDHDTAVVVRGTYADADVRARLVGEGVDILLHLASLPGGAAERNPALGKSVNLDGSLALLDAVARSDGPVVVYASSIAALGGGSGGPVTAASALRPSGSYGTHKAMIELYLVDLTRRGLIDGRTVRPAGVVARPCEAYAGFATAWMSDLFHAALDRRDVTIPARAASRIWLQSIAATADNIVHAATMPAAGLPSRRVWTLPATVVRVEALVDALRRRTGHDLRVTFGDGATDLPSLDAGDALAAGFVSDGDADALVEAVLSGIGR